MAILIADTGNIYPSISAAAKAVGVDPSNARKAVRGQRKSAGGYTFVEVAAAPLQKEITKLAKKVAESLTPKQQQRRAQQRQRSQQRVQERRRSEQPARRRTAAERERIQQIHAALVEANDMIRRAKRGETGAITRKDLEALAEQVGASKQGMFKTSTKDIQQYQEIDQIIARIQAIKEQDAARREQQAVSYAQQYSLKTTADAKRKQDALDDLSRAYGRLREAANRASGAFKYVQIYEDMTNDVKDLDPDQIQLLADKLDDWLDTTKEQTQEDLDKIIEQWQMEVEGASTDGDDDDDDDTPTYITYR